MDKTRKSIERAFNGAGMPVSISPSGDFKVECCTDLWNKVQDEAMTSATEELKTQAKSFRLTLSTVAKRNGYILANFNGNTPSEVAHFLRKTSLGKCMKARKEGLEIDANEFEMSIRERMKAHRNESMAKFRRTIRDLIYRGHMSPKTPIEKIKSGDDIVFLFNPSEG